MHWKPGLVLTAGLVLASSSLLQAQHSDYGHGGSGVPASRSAARSAGPNLGGRPYPIRTDIAPPTGLIPPAAAYTGISPGALGPSVNGGGGHRGGRDGVGVGIGYGGFYGLPYLPYADTSTYYSFPSFSEQAEAISARNEAQVRDAANAQQQNNLAQQMDQITEELRSLRQGQLSGPASPSPQSPQSQVTARSAEPQAPQQPIVLVLQNGARLSITNYAVMNNVIWDFSKQPARKIPVSTVNVAASEKLTQENGAEFPKLTPDK